MPWWDAVEALAAADEIVVHRSSTTIGAGSFWVPAVEIGRPDGGAYPWQTGTASDTTWRNVILPAVNRDWGQTLVRARKQAGIVPGQPDRTE